MHLSEPVLDLLESHTAAVWGSMITKPLCAAAIELRIQHNSIIVACDFRANGLHV